MYPFRRVGRSFPYIHPRNKFMADKISQLKTYILMVYNFFSFMRQHYKTVILRKLMINFISKTQKVKHKDNICKLFLKSFHCFVFLTAFDILKFLYNIIIKQHITLVIKNRHKILRINFKFIILLNSCDNKINNIMKRKLTESLI